MSLPAVTVLTERQNELVDLYLSGGLNQRQMAETMQADEAWVSKTLRKPHVQTVLYERVASTLGTMSVQAAHKLSSLLQSKSDYVALEAAKDLLDRTGHKPPDRKQIEVNERVTFTVEL